MVILSKKDSAANLTELVTYWWLGMDRCWWLVLGRHSGSYTAHECGQEGPRYQCYRPVW